MLKKIKFIMQQNLKYLMLDVYGVYIITDGNDFDGISVVNALRFCTVLPNDDLNGKQCVWYKKT